MTPEGISVYPDAAACRGRYRLMWPALGESAGARDLRERRARALCAACPVSAACAAVVDEVGMRGTGGVMAGRVFPTGTGRPVGRPRKSDPSRPRSVACRDCGAMVSVSALGPIPTRCTACRRLARIASANAWRLKSCETVTCTRCGRPCKGAHGLATHQAIAHGIPGIASGPWGGKWRDKAEAG